MGPSLPFLLGINGQIRTISPFLWGNVRVAFQPPRVSQDGSQYHLRVSVLKGLTIQQMGGFQVQIMKNIFPPTPFKTIFQISLDNLLVYNIFLLDRVLIICGPKHGKKRKHSQSNQYVRSCREDSYSSQITCLQVCEFQKMLILTCGLAETCLILFWSEEQQVGLRSEKLGFKSVLCCRTM